MYLLGCLKGVALLNLAIQSMRNYLKPFTIEMTGSLRKAKHSLNVKRTPDVAIAQTIEDGLEEPMYSFADRLEIGCSLTCITGDKIANPQGDEGHLRYNIPDITMRIKQTGRKSFAM